MGAKSDTKGAYQMFKPGDKVVMNDNYYVSEQNKGRIWTVRSEPWMCCGRLVVALEGKSGGYAVNGLSPAKMDGGEKR
jgi:hypothetical protein